MNSSKRGFARIGVIGVGLIGGSVALRAAEVGVAVRLWDPHPAKNSGSVDEGLTWADSMAEVVDWAELLVVATPLTAMQGVFDEVAGRGFDGVLIDVGSVKGPIQTMIASAGLGDRYVGTHPMAGKESAGFAHASADLLVGKTWAMCAEPDAVNDALARNVCEWLVDTFACAVSIIPAYEHDQSVALASHVPHVLANLLLGQLEHSPLGALTATLAAGSFRDGTRVAGRHVDRTLAMVLENRPAVVDALRPVVKTLNELVSATDIEGFTASVEVAMTSAIEGRSLLSREPTVEEMPVVLLQDVVPRCLEGWCVISLTADTAVLELRNNHELVKA